MDVVDSLDIAGSEHIKCIEMHTAGMPSRIIVSSYPKLTGTLAEQKAQALEQYDFYRKLILLEPRGRQDMYGVILCPETELTMSGQAHMGILYAQVEGISNMCGHATIAAARFLLDTQDDDLFPRRERVPYDPSTKSSRLVLHAPGGLVEVDVLMSERSTVDTRRPVSFNAVPAYALALDLTIEIPTESLWPELEGRQTVSVSLGYCGASTCVVSLEELGFPLDAFWRPSLFVTSLKTAAKQLRSVINSNPAYTQYLQTPEHDKPGSIFGVMVTDRTHGVGVEGSKSAEGGVLFFGENQNIDRSPTGSVAALRATLAFTRGEILKDESWTYYNPLVANHKHPKMCLVATVLVQSELNPSHQLNAPIRTSIQGYAFYTGSHTFFAENDDPLGSNGFQLQG